MAKSIRTALSPLLIISYVCGLKIVEFPAGYPRPWLSCLYHLVLWPTYCYFIMKILLVYVRYEWMHYRIFLSVQILTTLLLLSIRIYHDKQFRNCLRKLDIVDETLKELGTTTDYQKLDTKMTRLVVGWFVVVSLWNLGEIVWWQKTYDVLIALWITFLVNYSSHTNLIGDLKFAYILGYIGLKFDQVNEHFQRLANGEFTDRGRRIKRAWENNFVAVRSHRRKCPDAPSSEFMAWIVMHLHLDLCKISHDINSVFGIQITVKMTSYYCFIAESIFEFVRIIFNNCYTKNKKELIYIAVITFMLLVYIYQLLLINYSCEMVSNKANATRNIIDKVMCSTCNVEVRECIAQLLLQIIRAPLRFCGIGLFEFGFKFLHSYVANIMSYVVILLQANKNNYWFLRN